MGRGAVMPEEASSGEVQAEGMKRTMSARPGQPAVYSFALDSANAERNAREVFGEDAGHLWKEHRKEVMSEMRFKLQPAIKAFFYEISPILVTAPFVRLLEGYVVAVNRKFWPTNRKELVAMVMSDLMLPMLPTWTTLVIVVLWHSSLKVSALYEVVTLFLVLGGRASTLGIKYAFYGDLLFSHSENCSIHTTAYTETSQMAKQQMSTYIMNMSNQQKEVLVKLLYKSCLYHDVDLSCAFLNFKLDDAGPSDMLSATAMVVTAEDADLVRSQARMKSIRRTVSFNDKPSVTVGLWNSLVESLSEIDGAFEFFESMDENGSGDIDVEELQVALAAMGINADMQEIRSILQEFDVDGNGRLSFDEFHELVRRLRPGVKFSDLKQSGAALVLHAIRQTASHPLLRARSGLLACLLRENNEAISARVQQGEVPASVVALSLLLECFYLPQKQGVRYFMAIMLLSLAIAFLPLVIRACLNQPVLGTNMPQHMFYMFHTLASYGFFIMAYFAYAPCLWLWRQMCLAQKLLDLIAPPTGISFDWSLRRSSVASSRPSLPRLDLRKPGNVEGWAALWRVMHGRAFAPSIELKLQLYSERGGGGRGEGGRGRRGRRRTEADAEGSRRLRLFRSLPLLGCS
eukprot:311337-Hanusia_phi.AAC.2